MLHVNVVLVHPPCLRKNWNGLNAKGSLERERVPDILEILKSACQQAIFLLLILRLGVFVPVLQEMFVFGFKAFKLDFHSGSTAEKSLAPLKISFLSRAKMCLQNSIKVLLKLLHRNCGWFNV